MTTRDIPEAPATSGPTGESRDERLARQLRENLRRRKAQARALKAGPGQDAG